MPRFPHLADRTTRVEGSTFEAFLPRLRRHEGGFHKLHIGDADRGPDYRLDYREGFAEEHPHAFQYANTWGVGRLREAIAEKLREENGLSTRREDVLVTAGATNALSAAVQSLVEDGDEVLVLTPAWPFFRGMVPIAGGRVRELPFYPGLRGGDPIDVEATVEEAGDAPDGGPLPQQPKQSQRRGAHARGGRGGARGGPPPRPVGDLRRGLRRHALRRAPGLLRPGLASGGAPDGFSVHLLQDLSLRGPAIGLGHRAGGSAGCHEPDDGPPALRSHRSRAVHDGRGPAHARRVGAPAAAGVPGPARSLPRGPRPGRARARGHLLRLLRRGGAPGPRRHRGAGGALRRRRHRGEPGADFGHDFTTWLRLCFIAEEEPRANEGARRLRALL